MTQMILLYTSSQKKSCDYLLTISFGSKKHKERFLCTHITHQPFTHIAQEVQLKFGDCLIFFTSQNWRFGPGKMRSRCWSL